MSFSKVLYSATQINDVVQELANQINMKYADVTFQNPLVLICILKGSFIFFSDITRKINIPQIHEFMTVSSYINDRSTGKINILADITIDIKGKDVLIIEDIFDTGVTLDCLLKELEKRNPKSLECCVLLSKPTMVKVPIKPAFVGIELNPPEFVIGYGLDYNQLFRNLPFIAVPTNETIKLFKRYT